MKNFRLISVLFLTLILSNCAFKIKDVTPWCALDVNDNCLHKKDCKCPPGYHEG